MDRAYRDTSETDCSPGTSESVSHPGGFLPRKVPPRYPRHRVRALLRNLCILSPLYFLGKTLSFPKTGSNPGLFVYSVLLRIVNPDFHEFGVAFVHGSSRAHDKPSTLTDNINKFPGIFLDVVRGARL
jgi:hypothetical protein